MSNQSAMDLGSNSKEEDISDGANRGTKRKHSDASKDPPQLSVKLPRMSDIQSPTKDRNHTRLPVDILLLTVKDCEFLACYMHLNNPFRCWFDGLGFVYFEDENEGQDEKVKVALLRCNEGSSGPGGSIVTTKNAVSVLMPKAVILVGTCGSLRPEETNLGDVVISAKLTTYGLKVVTNDKELHNNIRTFASKRFLDLIKDSALGWEAPLENSEDREVKIHSSGELLSVPEVINTELRRKQLAETFPLAVAVDTEAEGLYKAAFDLQVEWLVVKGISSYADGRESTNEKWNQFASANAASLVAKILNDDVVFKRWPHYQGDDDNVIKGLRPSPLETFLPKMVPYFTGRRSECDEIMGHLTSDTTQLVTIWGSPGFGKTSVAIAVGHDLRNKGMPVCWLSLRGLRSKAALTSKILGCIRPSVINEQPSFLRLSLDDQICQLLNAISERSFFILDNADDLLESGDPEVKEDVLQLIEEILRRNEKLTIVVTTRESLEFMNVHFQGHKSVRIRTLEEAYAQTLVQELLSNVSSLDCRRITQICGFVPLAIKLLCCSISEYKAQPSQFLDEFIQHSASASIIEMLDNADHPPNHRLQFLVSSSFQRLNAQEREALVSLSILPDNFGSEVAAAVLGKNTFQTKKILQSFRRKSLLDLGLQEEFFTMHKLIQTFAREKGLNEMKDTVLKSKHHLHSFYVSLFEKLNRKYLTGHSMEAFLAFYNDEQSIVQSLMESLSDPVTARAVFEVLAEGDTTQLLCRAKETAESSALPLVSNSEPEGKRLCYLGINYLASSKTEEGVQYLKEALQLMHGSPDLAVLRLVVLQILSHFSQIQNHMLDLNQLLYTAKKECKAVGDTDLLLISSWKSKERKTGREENQKDSSILSNHPLRWQVLDLVTKATKNFVDTVTKQHLRNISHKMLKEIEIEQHVSSGLFRFHRNVITLFKTSGDTKMLVESRISYHQTALSRCDENSSAYHLHSEALAACYMDLGNFLSQKNKYSEAFKAQQQALGLSIPLERQEHASIADSYHDLSITHHSLGDFKAALDSKKHALEIRLKLFGEKHASTADSYHGLGVTQHSLGDFKAALDSTKHALEIRLKLFEEEHASTADSYDQLGVTQHSLGDLKAALDRDQHALEIRLKLFGEEHASTADSYHRLGDTQHSLGDFKAALDSKKHALEIRLKLFGEEHASTADSYHRLGVTQHSLGDFKAALDSKKHALEIRLKLFGEEHASTADSYHRLGVTHHSLGDFKAALDSKKHALEIRLKLFGEEHASTADSYHRLGVTQHSLGDFKAALDSKKHALEIRLKLFGEEHASTADSYHRLGVTQHSLGDFKAALDSKKHALEIRLKLFGEEHASTADSYHRLGVTQHSLGDFKAALDSKKHALEIRLKLFGEEHASTADSYHRLGVTQHSLGDFKAALDSKKHALEIRLKLFGEEHASTADSYHRLGVTQHSLGDFKAALDSKKHALEIRLKLFGEEHASTADSYHRLGVTQHSLGDFKAALDSKKHALEIRLKLFGEEHASTADSYHRLGVTQHSLGDFKAALDSKKHALEIRLKLFGEEHASTADSYHRLGVTQHSLGDFKAALDSKKHALEIRLKLFGEEHASTADSYHNLGALTIHLENSKQH
ncbi:unnamed protein product [Porites evermanni]|uniref:AAA+ ATPase domain-containing protein n=1 Tax=Porites evermanni TaxID=104178 RepID=A0ABN8S7V4_9CNID|nr:unnamed protein product [Porites evermanni]